MLKICIYIGINAHVTPADGHTDTHMKVEQYSAEAESAINKCKPPKPEKERSYKPDSQA